MMQILGENYEEIKEPNAVLWRGDLILLDDSCDEDCKAYMVYVPSHREEFYLINYVGRKAGLRLLGAYIPMQASEPGCDNIRVSWLEDNWDDAVGMGSFGTTKFLRWSGR